MLMMADHVIKLEDLVIKGCRVLFSAAKHGFEYVMIRFKSFRGRLNRIFTEPYQLPQLKDTAENHQTRHAMEGVFLPLFNFAAHIDSMLETRCLSAPEEQLLRTVKREIGKLHYSSDLLGYLVACTAITDDRPVPRLEVTDCQSRA